MFKFEKILIQTCRHKKNFNLESLSLKYFTSDKITTDAPPSHVDSHQAQHEKTQENNINVESISVDDYAKTFAKQAIYSKVPEEYKEQAEQNQSFASLLRHSNFMHVSFTK